MKRKFFTVECELVNDREILALEHSPFCNHHSNNLIKNPPMGVKIKLLVCSSVGTEFLHTFKIPPQ